MSCFLTFFIIIKTVFISCNWTDQLLYTFTYKMALCTSHSHSFVIDGISDEKIQQNTPSRFTENLIFLGGCFFMPHPVDTLCILQVSREFVVRSGCASTSEVALCQRCATAHSGTVHPRSTTRVHCSTRLHLEVTGLSLCVCLSVCVCVLAAWGNDLLLLPALSS